MLAVRARRLRTFSRRSGVVDGVEAGFGIWLDDWCWIGFIAVRKSQSVWTGAWQMLYRNCSDRMGWYCRSAVNRVPNFWSMNPLCHDARAGGSATNVTELWLSKKPTRRRLLVRSHSTTSISLPVNTSFLLQTYIPTPLGTSHTRCRSSTIHCPRA